ncbi:MAG: prohead protease/major capsid protein fusion protein [Bradyrhizobium sp.]
MRHDRLLFRDSAVSLSHREAMPRPTSFDAEARTIEAVIASTTPVQRTDAKGTFWEILDPAGLDLDVTRGSSILDSHRSGGVASIIGKIDDCWIEGSEVIARIRFSERPEVAPIIADVRSGVISFLSVGYSVDKWKPGKNAAGERTMTATKWAAREASFVAVPADPAARTRAADIGGDDPPRRDRAATNRSIRELGRHAGVSQSVVDDLIDRGASLEESNMTILSSIIARGGVSIRASAHNDQSLDNPDVFQRAASEALYVRIAPNFAPMPQARQFVGMSCADMARECLRRNGISTQGMTAPSLVTRALQTTSDYPALLANLMNKSLRDAYTIAPGGIRRIAKETTANDFRSKSRIQIDHTGFILEKVNESAEFKYGSFIGSAESYAVDTFGKIFAISRKALINDDLGGLGDVTQRLGLAAAEFERLFLVNLLTAQSGLGPDMSDGNPLFDAAHGNIAVSAVLSIDSLSAARLKMRQQTAQGGGLISVVPLYLIVPSSLETTAEQLTRTIQPTLVTSVNPFESLVPVVEPRLPSATRWYLSCDPALLPCLEFAYLAGSPGPQIESRAGFEVDGVQTKVRLDYGAGFVEHRGLVTNAGV